MSLAKKIKLRVQRRTLRVRKKIANTENPRLSVFRSLNHIYAQVIDDKNHVTIASCSTLELKKIKGKKSDQAFEVGKELAKRTLDKGIKTIVFDRGPYLFHGRVKSLSEGLKEGGLTV